MSGYDSGIYDNGTYDDVPAGVGSHPETGPAPTLASVLAQASYTAVARITCLDTDLVTERRTFALTNAIVLSGTVTAELRRDVRRSASLELVNVDGSLSPALADDLFATGSAVRIERGALVGGTAEYLTLLTGFVTGCVASMAGTISLTAGSYMVALDQDAGVALTLPGGTFLVDALHILWDPVLPFVEWVVEAGADERALGADIPVLATDRRLAAGLAMADALGVDAYDDRMGRITLRLRPDPEKMTARVMTEPLSFSRATGQGPYNAQPIEGTVGTSEPTYVMVEVDDPSSPIHRDRIGLRMAPILRTDGTNDPATLRATARAWLAERAMAQDTLAVESLPMYLDIDEGDVLLREEPITRTSGKYIVDQVIYPVVLGNISTTEVPAAVLFLEDTP